MDSPGARDNLEALRHRFSTVEIAAVLAQTGEGLENLRAKLEGLLVNASPEPLIERDITGAGSAGD